VRTPLKDLISGLDPDRFWQIHRATVVNVNAVAAAERLDAERMQVLIKGCSEKLPVSRTCSGSEPPQGRRQ
jgi:DNA-binding LytR/AlgR family response regulator